MSDEDILKIIMFLKLEVTLEQFNKIIEYLNIDKIFIDIDDKLKVHVTSKNSNKIKCNITLIF